MASKKMKLWTRAIFCLWCSSAAAQTCIHSTTRSPVGVVLVFQNGALLNQGSDYVYTTIKGGFPTISPLIFGVGDRMSVIFSRQVPLSFTYQGVNVPYIGYALWQESWTCSTGNKTPAAVLGSLQVCSGSGLSPAVPNTPAWDPAATYAAGVLVNWASASWASLQAMNTANPPDTSPLWWKGLAWDCGGLYAVSITLGNGTVLSILGPSMAVPAPAPGVTWAPVN